MNRMLLTLCFLAVTRAHSEITEDSWQDFLPPIELQETFNDEWPKDNFTQDFIPPIELQGTFNDEWPKDNSTPWWEKDDVPQNISTDNATVVNTATTDPILSLVKDIMDFFTPQTNKSEGGRYLFITYVDLVPMIPCTEIEKVVSLFDARISEANPLARLRTQALELEGRACNGTRCSCEADGRRKLASKTLAIHTRSSTNTLRPVRSFPLQHETVAVLQ